MPLVIAIAMAMATVAHSAATKPTCSPTDGTGASFNSPCQCGTKECKVGEACTAKTSKCDPQAACSTFKTQATCPSRRCSFGGANGKCEEKYKLATADTACPAFFSPISSADECQWATAALKEGPWVAQGFSFPGKPRGCFLNTGAKTTYLNTDSNSLLAVAGSESLCRAVQCSCTTPNKGTVGHNQYACTDGSTASCGNNEQCSSTTPFNKDNVGNGCEVTCSCDTPNKGTVGFNQYTCMDGTNSQCAKTEACYATGPFSKTRKACQVSCTCTKQIPGFDYVCSDAPDTGIKCGAGTVCSATASFNKLKVSDGCNKKTCASYSCVTAGWVKKSGADALTTLNDATCCDAHSCKPGQVDYSGSRLFQTADNSMTACQAKCSSTTGCVAFDYSTNYKYNACRGVSAGQTPRLERPGKDNRQYCAMPGQATLLKYLKTTNDTELNGGMWTITLGFIVFVVAFATLAMVAAVRRTLAAHSDDRTLLPEDGRECESAAIFE